MARSRTSVPAATRSLARRRRPRPAAAGKVPEELRLFETVKRYVGFTERDSALLASFHRHVKPQIPVIVEDFYARILADHGAAKVLHGGRAQVERLRLTLAGWLEGLLRGPHGADFARSQALIGRRHVMVGLDQAYSISGIYVFREHLDRILCEVYHKPSPRSIATQRAVSRALTIVLCLMLDTYREDYVLKILRAEQNATMKRLATLGEVAASIAHEIRNPLAGISGAIQVLTGECEAGDPRREVLEEIRKEILRLNKRVTELLIFARPAAPRLEQANPRELLKFALKLIAGDPAFREVQVSVRAQDSLPDVWVDPGQIQQVLLNLLLNAAQAMNGRGRIRLEARSSGGGQIEFAVEDTGPGVAEAIVDKVFKPFFTTRQEGTGLGLAISSKIVESHGGTIELGKGRGGSARLTFRLPVQPPAANPHPPMS